MNTLGKCDCGRFTHNKIDREYICDRCLQIARNYHDYDLCRQHKQDRHRVTGKPVDMHGLTVHKLIA